MWPKGEQLNKSETANRKSYTGSTRVSQELGLFIVKKKFYAIQCEENLIPTISL